ncbi:MAG: metallophosphoesterase [Ruminococcus sp.]|uniref:metallophosphoesterase n=1 Tax=Ruminococcus sp. TaxID=41978 RepID=UPI0025D69D06|nr:metallophosphoesterase [Ruminococcus sp.]MBR5683607.1 metallophosphoesterase [Ruminococcus sp.]
MASGKKKNTDNSAKKKEKEKKSSAKWLWLVLIAGIWWFSNYTLRTTVETVSSPKINSEIRIAVISDQHASKLGIGNKTILKTICRAEPDMVFMLGDMYTSGSDWELMQKPVELAKDIVSEGYPLYCVTGEHDYDGRYIEELKKAGTRVLDYDEEYVELRGSRLRIIGIDNVYYSPTFDLRNEYALDGGSFNILLAHIPNYEKFADFGADLTICADTHGEMARLPFGLGPVYCSEKDVWLPKLLHKELEIYDKGLFDYDGGKMFITSGIGVYPAPVRFNNRPEVAVIDLIPKG